MTDKIHVLIVSERWCDAAVGGSPSNHNYNIIGSLENTGLATIATVFMDEIAANGGSVNQEILSAVSLEQPDLIFFTPLPSHPINPSPAALNVIRRKFGIPIAAFYCDTALPGQVKFADTFGDAVDFNIAVDCYTVYPQVSTRPDLFLPLWPPQDTRVFYSDDTARDIDVSFIGSTERYLDRKTALTRLIQAGISIKKSGGQREQHLSINDYAALLRRSRVTLNFSKVFAPEVPTHQLKGRVLEAMLCGALLLEPNNLQTKRWLVPGEHYDTFGSFDELIEKVSFYLANEDARVAMTRCAAEKVKSTLSATAFWTAVFTRANLPAIATKSTIKETR
ncbi:MAG: glycosyltransferase [Alphaproteobacteria bacterium]|nr:glycosyltransferase [Alphaproteobacteria bacterium]